MRERFAVPQSRALVERLRHIRVRVEDALATEELDRIEKMSRGSDRSIDLESVFHAGLEVVGAVAWSCVHRAGAGVERNVRAEHTERHARVERMLELDLFHQLAFEARD